MQEPRRLSWSRLFTWHHTRADLVWGCRRPLLPVCSILVHIAEADTDTVFYLIQNNVHW